MAKIEAHRAGDSDFAPSTTLALTVGGTDGDKFLEMCHRQLRL
jgi:hypothetical protein